MKKGIDLGDNSFDTIEFP